MVDRLRRLWWLELVIVLIAVTAVSRLGVPENRGTRASGQPLVLRFVVVDRHGAPVPGAIVRVWYPDSRPGAAPRAYEGAERTSEDGEATLYSVVPGNDDRRILYSVSPPSRAPLAGTLRLPERAGTRTAQDSHVLAVSEDRNGMSWRADVEVRLP